nr:hypothetical protein CFP56_21950 [Quercus suber]
MAEAAIVDGRLGFDVYQPFGEHRNGHSSLSSSVSDPPAVCRACYMASYRRPNCTCLRMSIGRDVRMPGMVFSGQGNRFDILADHALVNDDSQPHGPAIEYRAVGQRRRMRNSRGTREGKRRRDARRMKAKHDAQKLDEQLSQQLNVLIQNVVIRNLPPRLQSASLATPMDRSLQMPRLMRQTGSLSAQLPLVALPELGACHRSLSHAVQLRGLSVDDIWSSCLARIGARSPMIIPKALDYPTLPNFNQRDLGLGNQPVFRDLSSLPESRGFYHSKLKLQESQLWRPRFEKRQSRFFPARSLSQPRVKLPPLTIQPTCQDSIVKSEVEKCQSPGSKLLNLAGSVEHLVSNATVELQRAEQRQSSAANLWNILKPHNQPATKIGEFSCRGEAASYASCCSADVETLPPNFELEGTEVPYVHSNSLLGIANEIATSPYATEHAAMVDSAIYLPRQDYDTPPMVGMNELLVDHDVAMYYDHPKKDALPLDTVASADVLTDECNLPSLADDTPAIACTKRVEHAAIDAMETSFGDSDAHFRDEGELFALRNIPATLPEESTVDLATFLQMGHGRDCWCQDCRDIPEVFELDTSNADDDEWTVCTPCSEHGPTIDENTPVEQSSELNVSDHGMGDRSSMMSIKSGCVEDPNGNCEGMEEDWIFDCDV